MQQELLPDNSQLHVIMRNRAILGHEVNARAACEGGPLTWYVIGLVLLGVNTNALP